MQLRGRPLRLLFIGMAGALLLVITSCFASMQNGGNSAHNYPYFRVQFIDKQTGWIIGPRLLFTANAGNTWSIIEPPRVGDSIRAEDGPEFAKYLVHFVDAEWGWRVSPFDIEAVEYSANRGASWSEPIKTGVKRRSLVFIDRKVGWVLGERVVGTHDGGRTWLEEPSLKGLELEYPYFLNPTYGWLASRYGVLARTSDGGKSWTVERSLPKGVRTIFFLTPTHGWAVGENGLIASSQNGGVDWKAQQVSIPFDQTFGERARLLDVFFLTAEQGWVVGHNGLILVTTDSGRNWQPASSPTRSPLSSIRFIDPLHGFAVGGNAEPAIPAGSPSHLVIESKDGGRTWQEKTFK